MSAPTYSYLFTRDFAPEVYLADRIKVKSCGFAAGQQPDRR